MHEELHEMDFHGQAAVHKYKIIMDNVGRSDVLYNITAVWRNGYVFSGLANHASLSGG